MIGSPNDGYTPLLAAAREGHADVVGRLLAAGANPRLVDDMMTATPGHESGDQGRARAARALVVDGRFEIDARGAYHGYTEIVDLLGRERG